MTRGQAAWLVILMVAVLISGIGVVYAKFQSRALFVELQHVRAARDLADLDWGRLQLELATRGALERVMSIANQRLQMRIPEAQHIVVVR